MAIAVSKNLNHMARPKRNDDADIKISMEALGFFKTLRNQAVLAIQQFKK